MIPIIDLLYEIDQKLNKVANLQGQFIPDEDKILYLNRNQIKLVLKKIGLNNNYQMGLDSFKKRYQDLEVLVVPFEQLEVTTTVGDLFNSSNADLTTTSQPYFLPLDAYILGTRNNCKNRTLDVIELVKHGDIQTKLKSPHWTPSFEHQESLGTISNNKFYVYPDLKKTFEINSLYLSYLRYPKEMDIAGYQHLNGEASTDVDCELDGYLKNELLEMTIKEISRSIGDQANVQNSENGEKESE